MIGKKFIRQLQWRIECANNRIRDIANKKHRILTTNEVEYIKDAHELINTCHEMLIDKIGPYKNDPQHD